MEHRRVFRDAFLEFQEIELDPYRVQGEIKNFQLYPSHSEISVYEVSFLLQKLFYICINLFSVTHNGIPQTR
jgi:hypothetical protein